MDIQNLANRFSYWATQPLTRLAQVAASTAPKADISAELNKALLPLGYKLQDGTEAEVFPNEKYVDVQVIAGPKAKWNGHPNQAQQVKMLLDPITTSLTGCVAKPVIHTASVNGGMSKEAAKKSKKTKHDPKAEVRNRGKVAFPAESPKVKDDKDHFELNTENQARNALARAGAYTKAPSWYSGSLEELKSALRRAVHKAYPSIEISKSKKKTKKSELATEMLKLAAKFEMKLAAQDITPELNKALAPYGYAIAPGTAAMPSEAGVDVKVQPGPKAAWRGKGVAEMDRIKGLLDPITMSLLNLASNPIIYT